MIGIYCNHTSIFPHNTGIQRCVRATATALHNQGELIIPFVWNNEFRCIEIASETAIAHLGLWGGPPVESWSFQALPAGHWIVVIELISGPNQPSQSNLRSLADSNNWKLMSLFHDDIPLEWGGAAAEFHSTYMKGLAKYDLVVSTSSISRSALETFWKKHSICVFARVETVGLAAEIPGVPQQPPQFTTFKPPLQALCVASLEPRKNHSALFKAIAWLSAHSNLAISFVLVGWPNHPGIVAMLRRAQSLRLPIIYEGSVNDVRLVQLYNTSNFSIYPSLLEGFGMPVLESCWLGKPCLAGGVPALIDLPFPTGCFVLSNVDWRSIAATLEQIQSHETILISLKKNIIKMELKSWSDYVINLLYLMREC